MIQHVVVTVAFAFDLDAIRESTAVPWTALAVAGAALAVLYAIAFDLRRRRPARRGVHVVIVALALADIVGEFIAQGTLAIAINVSFIVALALLALVAADRRRAGRGD